MKIDAVKFHIIRFLKVLIVFGLGVSLLKVTIGNSFWVLDQMGRFILALPYMFILIHLMQLCDLVFFIFSREKYVILEKIKTKTICDKSFLGSNLVIKGNYFLAQSSIGNKTLFLLSINRDISDFKSINTYKSVIRNKEVPFDFYLISLNFFKLQLCYLGYIFIEFIYNKIF